MSVGEEMGKLAWEGVGTGCKSDPAGRGEGRRDVREHLRLQCNPRESQ